MASKSIQHGTAAGFCGCEFYLGTRIVRSGTDEKWQAETKSSGFCTVSYNTQQFLPCFFKFVILSHVLKLGLFLFTRKKYAIIALVFVFCLLSTSFYFLSVQLKVSLFEPNMSSLHLYIDHLVVMMKTSESSCIPVFGQLTLTLA